MLFQDLNYSVQKKLAWRLDYIDTYYPPFYICATGELRYNWIYFGLAFPMNSNNHCLFFVFVVKFLLVLCLSVTIVFAFMFVFVSLLELLEWFEGCSLCDCNAKYMVTMLSQITVFSNSIPLVSIEVGERYS